MSGRGPVRRFLRILGPGMIMMATVVGASHVILSPVAGARFGYSLLWLVLFSHLFKYPAFDYGARFAVARGFSLIRGYQLVPGPRNWALWVFLTTTTLQGLAVTTGIMSVTASIVLVNVGLLPFTGWIVVLNLFIIGIHRFGRYGALQLISKVMMFVLAAITVLAFSVSQWSAGDLLRIFVPSVPDGATPLASSIVGLMPAGINVAVWHSLWAVAHLPYWEEQAKDRRHMLAMSLTDLRIAYWMSAILAMMFMSLGASLLRPRGLTPDGLDVAITISTIYTELLGDWMYPVFMIAVFAAMFSTAYTVMDGFPRAFSTIARDLFPESASLRRPGDPAYWTFMLVIFGFIVITNTLIPNPVLLVSLTGLLSLLVSPVLYVLNYYCVTRLIDDPALRPSMTNRIWGILGVVTMSASVVFFLYSQYVG